MLSPCQFRVLVPTAVVCVAGAITPSALAQWVATPLHPSDAWGSTAFGVSGSLQVGEINLSGAEQAALWDSDAESWINLSPPGASKSFLRGGHEGVQVGQVVIGGLRKAGKWAGSSASWVDLHPASATRSIAYDASATQQAGAARFNQGLDEACLWTGDRKSVV